MFIKALTDFIFGSSAAQKNDNNNTPHRERRSSKFHNDEYQYPKFIPETPKETTPSKRSSKKKMLTRQDEVQQQHHEEVSPKSYKGSILSTPKSTSNKTPTTPRAVQLSGSHYFTRSKERFSILS